MRDSNTRTRSKGGFGFACFTGYAETGWAAKTWPSLLYRVSRKDPAPPGHLPAGSPSGPQGAGRIPLPSVALPKCFYLPTQPPPLSPSATFFLFLSGQLYSTRTTTPARGSGLRVPVARADPVPGRHLCPGTPPMAGHRGRVESRLPDVK